MKLKERILNLLFPPKCVLCQRILGKEETDLCHSCRKETKAFPKPKTRIPNIAQWRSLWYYDGNVRQSLLRYKFRGKQSYSRLYGQMLALSVAQQLDGRFDLLTWVPISAKRKRSRGFDQTEMIVRQIGQELGIPVTPLFVKIRHNKPQSGCKSREARKANVLGVYRVTEPASVAGKRILLVDDILTTGATVSECARVLLTAGAAQILCATVAATTKNN